MSSGPSGSFILAVTVGIDTPPSSITCSASKGYFESTAMPKLSVRVRATLWMYASSVPANDASQAGVYSSRTRKSGSLSRMKASTRSVSRFPLYKFRRTARYVRLSFWGAVPPKYTPAISSRLTSAPALEAVAQNQCRVAVPMTAAASRNKNIWTLNDPAASNTHQKFPANPASVPKMASTQPTCIKRHRTERALRYNSRGTRVF